MVNSVKTNVGSLVALHSLNVTNESLAKTQDRISTKLRVIGGANAKMVEAVKEMFDQPLQNV